MSKISRSLVDSKCLEKTLKTMIYQTYQTPKDAAETFLSQGNSATMIENNDISTVTVTSAENNIITTWYDLYLYQ